MKTFCPFPLNNQQGIALFLVLWVLALLSVIVGQFCHAMRTETNITRNFTEKAQAQYIAQAGLNMAINELMKKSDTPRQIRSIQASDAPEPDHWRINAENPQMPFSYGWFQVIIDNHSGRVNLNTAGPNLLKMMLNRFEIDEEQKAVIVDSIIDWRDPDHFHRLNGAENDYYSRLPEPYKAKNADFDAAEELLLVRGVSREIFYSGLKEMVTVYTAEKKGEKPKSSGKTALSDKININAASEEMLLSLPQITPDHVEAIHSYRQKMDIERLSELIPVIGEATYAAIIPYLTLETIPFYSIRSTGMLAEGEARHTMEFRVRIDSELEKGFRIFGRNVAVADSFSGNG